MDIFADYHIHTHASDGQGTVGDKFACASARGLKTIAVTDHGPASIIFHQNEMKFAAEHADIEKANRMNSVRVLQSIECNILGDDGELDVPLGIMSRCDILHFGFHRLISASYVRRAPRYFLVNGWGLAAARREEDMVDYNTRAVIAAMKRYPVDVLCHPCHRAILDMRKVCAAAEELGVHIELNEKHIDTMEECIDTVLESGVKFILGSDAHATRDVGRFDKVKSFIAAHRIPPDRICGLGVEPVFRDKSALRAEAASRGEGGKK